MKRRFRNRKSLIVRALDFIGDYRFYRRLGLPRAVSFDLAKRTI